MKVIKIIINAICIEWDKTSAKLANFFENQHILMAFNFDVDRQDFNYNLLLHSLQVSFINGDILTTPKETPLAKSVEHEPDSPTQ
jgi:hypothetical protein